jgi:hypothetical protein
MPLTRLSAVYRASLSGWRMRQAQRRERAALARVGEAVAVSKTAGNDHSLRHLITHAANTRSRIEALSEDISRSFDADLADYAMVARWVQPLIVVRGLSGRAVLRYHRTQCRHGLRPVHEALGRAAMEKSAEQRAELGVPLTSAGAVRAARTEREAAAAERAMHLAPFGGTLPGWMTWLATESTALGRAIAGQLRAHLFSRLSALGGLAAGWWVANTFTDSPWKSALRSLGIGRGGTHVVSAEAYRAMRFWAPILAAAICAYLGDRLAQAVRRRYFPALPSPVEQDARRSRSAA